MSVKKAKDVVFGVVDDRGEFINYDVGSRMIVKRAYVINDHGRGTVRAFHGHEEEQKFIIVLQGAIQVVTFPTSDVDEEKKKISGSDIDTHFYRGGQSAFIPNGFYHGIKSLTDDTMIVVLSNKTVNESLLDDKRLPWDCVGKEVWGVKFR